VTVKVTSKIKVSNFKLELNEEDKKFILDKTREVLSSHRWTVGPVGEAFEEAFKKYVGASYAVAVSSGGAALITLLEALRVPEDSIVICPTLTAPPTPHGILASNRKVVFADSDSEDLGLDPENVGKQLRQYQGKVGAVISVHVAGWISPRIRELQNLCQASGIPLIEDCAHAHGSWLEGRHAGSTTGLAAYSFFMTKPLTSGEGGIVTVEDPSLVEVMKTIRNYGKNEQGKHVIKGFNFKLSEFNAAVALWSSLNGARLADQRRNIASSYDQLLVGTEGLKVVDIPDCKSSYYKYIVTLDRGINRDRIREILLKDYGIEASGGIYDTLCHEEPYFRKIPDRVLNCFEAFPRGEDFSRRQLCLPLYPGLTQDEIYYVVESLRRVLKRERREVPLRK